MFIQASSRATFQLYNYIKYVRWCAFFSASLFFSPSTSSACALLRAASCELRLFRSVPCGIHSTRARAACRTNIRRTSARRARRRRRPRGGNETPYAYAHNTQHAAIIFLLHNFLVCRRRRRRRSTRLNYRFGGVRPNNQPRRSARGAAGGKRIHIQSV